MSKEIMEVMSKNLGFYEKLSSEEPKQYLKQHEKVTKVSDKIYYLGLFADKEYFKVSSTNFGVGYVLAEAIQPIANKHRRSNKRTGGTPNASS